MRVRPRMASTCGMIAPATAVGSICDSCVTACLASSGLPNTPASPPRKMQNGKSDTMNENATAPAMEKPECS